jgi:lysozyme family protein
MTNKIEFLHAGEIRSFLNLAERLWPSAPAPVPHVEDAPARAAKTDLFEEAVNFVLKYEGGFSNHPLDPGGATNMGITIATLSEARGRKVTVEEVKNLTLEEAKEIYRQRYWEPCLCDRMPRMLAIPVFDCAVNQGNRRAGEFLQLAAGMTGEDVDGDIGRKTIEKVNAGNVQEIFVEFMSRRMEAYGKLTNLFRTFGLGWSRRLMSCHTFAIGQ